MYNFLNLPLIFRKHNAKFDMDGTILTCRNQWLNLSVMDRSPTLTIESLIFKKWSLPKQNLLPVRNGMTCGCGWTLPSESRNLEGLNISGSANTAGLCITWRHMVVSYQRLQNIHSSKLTVNISLGNFLAMNQAHKIFIQNKNYQTKVHCPNWRKKNWER